MNSDFYFLNIGLLSSLGEIVDSGPKWISFFWSLWVGLGKGFSAQAQPHSLSLAPLDLPFFSISRLRLVLHRGLCASQLTNLASVHLCCVPGCQQGMALWKQQTGRNFQMWRELGPVLSILPSPLVWKTEGKEVLGPWPNEMHCPERGRGREWGRELMLVDLYSRLWKGF